MPIHAILPGGDAAADEAQGWGQLLLKSFPGAPPPVMDAATANPRLAQQIQAWPATRVVAYFGHGLRDKWLWHQGTLLLLSEAAVFSQRHVIAVACYSGALLGREANARGAHLYVGFVDQVAWSPAVPVSGNALGECISYMVKSVLTSVKANPPPSPISVELDVKLAISEHVTLWERRRAQGDSAAIEVLRSLRRLLSALVVY